VSSVSNKEKELDKPLQQCLQQHPWLTQRNLPMVTNNDLDGIVSASFLSHHLGWRLIGFYDLKKLWLDTEFEGDLSEPVYVDLDVTYPNLRAIGHHVQVQRSETQVNPNFLYGVTLANFEVKYPMGTILFLMALHRAEVPKREECKALLLHSDSTWKSFYGLVGEKSQRMKEVIHQNVLNWVGNRLRFPQLCEMLESLSGEQFEAVVNKHVVSKTSTVFSKDQCPFSLEYRGRTVWESRERTKVEFLTKMIADVTGWQQMHLPRQLRVAKTLTPVTLSSYDASVFDRVLPFFGDRIFSHGVTYFNPISMPVSLDIEDIDHAELQRALKEQGLVYRSTRMRG
jgi:hypothetical protein